MRIFLVYSILIPTVIYGADHDLFKDCASVDFCNQLRDRNLNRNLFEPANWNVYESMVEIYFVKNDSSGHVVAIHIDALENENIFRVRIHEDNTTRYELDHVLNGEMGNKSFDDFGFGVDYLKIVSGDNSFVHSTRYQELSFSQNDVELVVLKEDTFYLENPNTNRAFAFEIQFPQSVQAYGIHEHADHIALQNTGPGGVDPYRLKNVDSAQYELNSTMANYGAIPVIYGHGPNYTAGIFVHNAAEQWYDINNSENGTNVYVMAESGSLDFFVLLGNTPKKVVRQYAELTGTAHLPQLWALGYHQSRYSYESQDDVEEVVSNFETSNFPMDAIWLDIDYTDGKKYFTWNSTAFSDPEGMQDAIAAVHKKLVTIIDPHLKVDAKYPVYAGALERDLFVKFANGTVFEGNCWPGLSSYVDFLNPAARDYYAEQYSYANFKGSTSTLAGIWNDMNEPSLFDDIDRAEKTIPGDALHAGGVRHRDIHNIYGLLHTLSTHQGLIARDEGKTRPFILTRSHFAGSQRVAAFWTGDNTADWGYLAVSYSECLNANILGYVFCGADVGGFEGDPDEELLQRWYQAGAWLPFYRAHSMGPNRREPYLFSDAVQTVIRNAIKLRYQHLPVWYTLFYEHTRYGDPIIRPLFYQYPQDVNNVAIDDQLLVGTDILVKAVTNPGVRSVNVYFPGGNEELWLSLDTKEVFTGEGNTNISVDLQNIPIYYRAGSIIATKVSDSLNTEETVDVDYTLIVNLDSNNNAEGTLYLDDNTSFNYRDNKEYLYVKLVYQPGSNNVTVVKIDDSSNSSGFEITIGQIVVNNVTQLPDGNGKPGIYSQTIVNTDFKFRAN